RGKVVVPTRGEDLHIAPALAVVVGVYEFDPRLLARRSVEEPHRTGIPHDEDARRLVAAHAPHCVLWVGGDPKLGRVTHAAERALRPAAPNEHDPDRCD